MTATTVVSLVGALGIGGFVTALLTLRPTRRKLVNEAEKASNDAASVVTSSAISLLEPMRLELESLRAGNTAKDVKIAEKDVLIAALKAQVVTLGGTPL